VDRQCARFTNTQSAHQPVPLPHSSCSEGLFPLESCPRSAKQLAAPVVSVWNLSSLVLLTHFSPSRALGLGLHARLWGLFCLPFPTLPALQSALIPSCTWHICNANTLLCLDVFTSYFYLVTSMTSLYFFTSVQSVWDTYNSEGLIIEKRGLHASALWLTQSRGDWTPIPGESSLTSHHLLLPNRIPAFQVFLLRHDNTFIFFFNSNY
jgi:hypothetical protein